MTEPLHRRRDLSPWSLSRADWLEVYRAVVREVRADHLTLLAAGVAFFGFLSLFPGLGTLVAAYGLLFDAADIQRHLAYLSPLLPTGSLRLLEQQLDRLTATAPEGLSLGVILALLAAIWSANRGARGLIEATNLAYNEEETRGYLHLTLLGFVLTVGLVVSFLVMMTLIAWVPDTLSILGLDPDSWSAMSWLRWPVVATLTLVGTAIVYAVAPDRKPPRWQWITPGSVFATACVLLSSAAFSTYVANVSSFERVYGSLGAVAILLLWWYLAAFLVLLGAEINSEAEAACAPDSPGAGA